MKYQNETHIFRIIIVKAMQIIVIDTSHGVQSVKIFHYRKVVKIYFKSQIKIRQPNAIHDESRN